MKIHDSKGKLYYICPFLDRIQKIVSQSDMNNEEVFEIMRHLESIQAIAKDLRGEDVDCGKLDCERVHSPYNFLALIKTIKIHLRIGSLTDDKIDEIIQNYL